ncbi:MAG: N-acetyltransferase [Clostridia bacterium]|nr:N-acetyltransferase [Clostridia bacterium]
MIRQAKKEEIDKILHIYDVAKAFMRANKNPTQWNDGYPEKELLLADMEKDELFVLDEGKGICACFALIGGIDPTYGYIEDGSWMSDSDYGTIHRIASDGTASGVFQKAVSFARETYDHIRVDTHKDNHPMQHVILKEGFSYRGIIYLENGDPRLAYEWMK